MTHPKCLQYFRKRVYKEEIKRLASEIREVKASVFQADTVFEASLRRSRARRLSNTIRHYHIAASLLRGRTREQIEKPRDTNLPDESYIQVLYDEGVALAEEQYKEYLEAV